MPPAATVDASSRPGQSSDRARRARPSERTRALVAHVGPVKLLKLRVHKATRVLLPARLLVFVRLTPHRLGCRSRGPARWAARSAAVDATATGVVMNHEKIRAWGSRWGGAFVIGACCAGAIVAAACSAM